VFVFLVLFVT